MSIIIITIIVLFALLAFLGTITFFLRKRPVKRLRMALGVIGVIIALVGYSQYHS